jgi:hypothetical protein
LARGGTAAIAIGGHGIEVTCTSASSVDFQGPLLMDDGQFFDDASSQWMALADLLALFLAKAKDVLADVFKP